MAEFPHMPFFTDAYLADTIHLTTEEHGAYMLLLITMWRTPDCSLPNDDKRLALYTRMSLAKWKKVRIVLEDFLTISDDKITQKRLQKERKFVSDKTQKNRDNGKKGGRPKSLKTNEPDKANGSFSDNPDQNPDESQKKAPTPTPTPTPTPKEEEKNSSPPDKPFEVGHDSPHAGDLSLYGDFLTVLECQNNFQMAGKFGIKAAVSIN